MRKTILVLLLIFSLSSIHAYQVYLSNSIWMALDRVEEIPETGYALKEYTRQGDFRLTEGFLDGDLSLRRSWEQGREHVTVTEENFISETWSRRTYRDSLLLTEEYHDRDGKETTRYMYNTAGELEQVSYWADEQLVYEQYLFRFRDGSLRTVFRYHGDTLLQSLVIGEREFSIGNEERMVKEIWEDDRHLREIYSRGEISLRYEEIWENSHRTVRETQFSPAKSVVEKKYSGDLLVYRMRESGIRKELTEYQYDTTGRLLSETYTETSGQRRLRRVTEYRYDELSVLFQSRISVNGELQEVITYDPSGAPVLRDIYRGGKVLFTYTYE